MEKEKALTFLKSQQTAVLSTVNADNAPHAAVMYYTVDNFLNIFLLTKSNTQKYKNALDINKVALTVIDSEQLKTVQVRGIIEQLPVNSKEYLDTLTQIAKMNAIKGGSSWPPPLSKLPNADIAVLKLTPNWLRFSEYANEKEEVFYQIIP